MSYEAIGTGIEPGGLRDKNEIKILICYLLKTVGKPLSFDHLNDILQNDGLVNYFEFAQAIHELLETGHIDLVTDEKGNEFYKSTRLGAGTAELFERRLPISVKEKAVKAAIKLLAKIKRESENRVDIVKTENGAYHVKCTILDQSDELLSVSLNVPDKMQADTIKTQFLNDPELVYRGVLALITGDTAIVKEILTGENNQES